MKVTSANTVTTISKSQRTTVPNNIVKYFNLKDKDRLQLELKSENDEFYIKITPVE